MAMTDVLDRLRQVPDTDLQYRTRAELETSREELRAARDGAYEEMNRITGVAAMTNTQRSDWAAADHRLEEAGRLLERVEDTLAKQAIDYSQVITTSGPAPGDDDFTGRMARDALIGSRDAYTDGVPLTRSQTFTGYAQARGLVRPGEESLSLRRYLRGMVTGNWDGADPERRAMSEGVLAAGGYMVPTILSAQIIDLARNQTRVLQAGARVVPMPNKTLDVAKWAGDPTAAWHTESAAIAATDATLGTVRLDAKALASRTVLSRELLEDATGIEEQLRAAFAAQFALTIDRAALYGTGTAPEPRGVKNTSGITLATLGANGTVIANHDFLVDAVGTLADLNETANAIIYSPRTARTIGKYKASDNQPMQAPEYLQGVPRYATAQILNTLTVGTSTDTSDAFTADWSQLYVGVRTGLQIQVLTERHADTGQIGLVSWWRGDIAVARAQAFHVTTGIRA